MSVTAFPTLSVAAFPTLVECLSDLPDPRVERICLHSLLAILVICAVLCGADGWDDMNAFGIARRDWLQERLDLPNDIPSADMFRRCVRTPRPCRFAELLSPVGTHPASNSPGAKSSSSMAKCCAIVSIWRRGKVRSRWSAPGRQERVWCWDRSKSWKKRNCSAL